MSRGNLTAEQKSAEGILGHEVGKANEALRKPGFAVESYDRDPQDSDAPSLPYDIGLVIPQKELADAAHLLVLSPPIIQEQLYCGCMEADQMMQRDFDLPSLSSQCAQRFPH